MWKREGGGTRWNKKENKGQEEEVRIRKMRRWERTEKGPNGFIKGGIDWAENEVRKRERRKRKKEMERKKKADGRGQKRKEEEMKKTILKQFQISYNFIKFIFLHVISTCA